MSEVWVFICSFPWWLWLGAIVYGYALGSLIADAMIDP